jgi:hypothetical protein
VGGQKKPRTEQQAGQYAVVWMDERTAHRQTWRMASSPQA